MRRHELILAGDVSSLAINQIADVLEEVANERFAQLDKWGVQNHCPWKYLSIIGEEFGEANKGVIDAATFENGKMFLKMKDNKTVHELLTTGKGNYREELIQMAACCVAAVECLDRKEWQG